MFSACLLSSVVLCCHGAEMRSPKETEVFEVSRKPMSHKQRVEDFGLFMIGNLVGDPIGGELGVRPHGANVTVVVPGSPAMRAGLQVGDVILEANGREVSNWQCPFNQEEVLGEAIEDIARGKSLKLLVSHGGSLGSPTETLTIRLLDMKRP